jgi:N-acetylneuraminic acid mutarotase
MPQARAQIIPASVFVIVLLSVITATAEPIFGSSASTTGSWALTGSMHIARISPIAVTLPNGKVLVTGGFNNPNSFASSELWDPSTGKWTKTGSMTVDRVNATITLLNTGKVLVAGGLTSGGPTTSCNLYDSATGKWTKTGSMGGPRYMHTATLLVDGRVLVAGGIGTQQGVSLDTAEIYDPTSGKWTGAAEMSTAREGHAASLLSDGDVLVTGGDAAILTGSQGSTEVYDPSRNVWTVVGRMTSSRFFHTQSTLGDGTVIVAGGAYGDGDAYNSFPSTDRFDPASEIWEATGAMMVIRGGNPTITGRSFHTATTLSDGSVLVAGGTGYEHEASSMRVLATAELYDPSTGTWTLTPDMHVGRVEHAAVALRDGRAMVIGGSTTGPATATAEIFTPGARRAGTFPMVRYPRAPRSSGHSFAPLIYRRESVSPSFHRGFAGKIGEWAPTSSMHFARAGAPATLLPNGNVLVEGCNEPFTTGGTSAEIFDPATGKWSVTGSMRYPRCGHRAILLPNGTVLVIGGFGGTKRAQWWSTAEVYDPQTGRWTVIGQMNSVRTSTGLAALPSGKFLAIAGAAQGTIPRDSADIFDPVANTFTETPSLNVSRYGFETATLQDGRVLVVAGIGQDSQPTITCELYDPVANVWTLTGSINEGPSDVVTLDDGDVLATDEINPPTAQLFDPSTGAWSATGAMHFSRIADSATLLEDGRVLVAGGEGPNSLILQSEIYDPATQHWTLDADLNTARWVQSSVRLADGRVLVAGGLTQSFVPITSAEIYTPR